MNRLTVGELKEFLKDAPDNAVIMVDKNSGNLIYVEPRRTE